MVVTGSPDMIFPKGESPPLEGGLGIRLWSRYARSPGVIRHDHPAALVQRTLGFSASRLPLLSQIQRRWMTAEFGPVPGGAGLIHLWPYDRPPTAPSVIAGSPSFRPGGSGTLLAESRLTGTTRSEPDTPLAQVARSVAPRASHTAPTVIQRRPMESTGVRSEMPARRAPGGDSGVSAAGANTQGVAIARGQVVSEMGQVEEFRTAVEDVVPPHPSGCLTIPASSTWSASPSDDAITDVKTVSAPVAPAASPPAPAVIRRTPMGSVVRSRESSSASVPEGETRPARIPGTGLGAAIVHRHLATGIEQTSGSRAEAPPVWPRPQLQAVPGPRFSLTPGGSIDDMARRSAVESVSAAATRRLPGGLSVVQFDPGSEIVRRHPDDSSARPKAGLAERRLHDETNIEKNRPETRWGDVTDQNAAICSSVPRGTASSSRASLGAERHQVGRESDLQAAVIPHPSLVAPLIQRRSLSRGAEDLEPRPALESPGVQGPSPAHSGMVSPIWFRTDETPSTARPSSSSVLPLTTADSSVHSSPLLHPRVVQRATDDSAAPVSSSAVPATVELPTISAGSSGAEPDVNQLAEQVYHLLCRKLAEERRRKGW